MKEIIATDTASLEDIIDHIHDSWFDTKNIRYDKVTEIVSIMFSYENRGRALTQKRLFLMKKLQIPYYEAYLKIHNAEKLILDDQEKVGRYDFNTLVFYPNQNKLIFNTGIPLLLEIVTRELKISLEITDNITHWKTVTTIFW